MTTILIVGCCSSNPSRPVANRTGIDLSAQVRLPVPYPTEVILGPKPGAQDILTKTLCSDHFVGAVKWKKALEAAGFDAEVAIWVIGHPGWRETFALRFRRPPIYGDVVGEATNEDFCVKYTIRVQSSRELKNPDPWNSRFKLEALVQLMRRVGGSQLSRMFNAGLDYLYPAGYP